MPRSKVKIDDKTIMVREWQRGKKKKVLLDLKWKYQYELIIFVCFFKNILDKPETPYSTWKQIHEGSPLGQRQDNLYIKKNVIK